MKQTLGVKMDDDKEVFEMLDFAKTMSDRQLLFAILVIQIGKVNVPLNKIKDMLINIKKNV